MQVISVANVTKKAEDAIVSNGGEVSECDAYVVTLPDGSKEIGEDVFLLPDGHQLSVRGESWDGEDSELYLSM